MSGYHQDYPSTSGGTASGYDHTNYQQIQRQLLKDQDQGLEALDDIIGRQKNIAKSIHSEICLHNEILDDINDGMDQNEERLIRNTRNIKRISKKSETCCYWIVIAGLFVAIILVAAW